MFKRVLSMIIVAALSVILFAGCTSSEPEVFDAAHFVDECRILVPSSQYDSSTQKDFRIIFAKAVLDKFGKSDYYKNMTDEERFEALDQIGKVLETYSYGLAEDGFVMNYLINYDEHSVSWTVKGFDDDTNVKWIMPGY